MASVLAQTGLNLTNPALAIAGVTAIVIPIAIHFLNRLRRRPHLWGAMRFLIEVQRRHRRRLRFEQMLLLAVRCLIPLCLGLALSGPVLRGSGRFWGLLEESSGDRGRFVCMVIDDSMSTQTIDGSGQSRFDRLRGLALAVIGGLEPGDRVAVWRAALPAEAIGQDTGRLDVTSARRVIGSMRPRYSRSDLVTTLTLVHNSLAHHRVPADRSFVVVISDFASDALPTDQTAPQALRPLGQRAGLWVTRPMPEAVNLQIAHVMPIRRTIMVDAGRSPPTLTAQVKLRRFVDDESHALTRVQLTAGHGNLNDPIGQATMNHRWSAGQREAMIHFNMPLSGLDEPSSPTSRWRLAGSAQGISIRAQIRSSRESAHTDMLTADDQYWTVATLRHRVRVALIEPDNTTGDQVLSRDAHMTPGQWLRLALAPQSPGDDALDRADHGAMPPVSLIELEDIEGSQLAAQSIQGIDVVMVTHPNLLDDQGWISLRGLAQRGGVVWVFMPPDDSSGAVWATAFNDHMGLDWQLGWDAGRSETPDPQEAGQPLAADDPVPELLNMLGADWRALLAPVRTYRWFDVTLRDPPVSSDTVWLRMSDGRPLLVSGIVGQGRVFLLTTAIDPRWTNLPTKPLFVPLLHETIRSVISHTASGVQVVTCGQRPVLDQRWSGAIHLDRSAPATQQPLKIPLQRSDGGGAQPATALNQPGVYVAEPVRVGQTLAVNVDPAGGDTRAVDPQRLGQWMSAAVGQWQWLEPAAPTRMFARPAAGATLSWPLLWPVLALLLLEIVLARWFSHPPMPKRSWRDRLAAMWRTNDQGRLGA